MKIYLHTKTENFYELIGEAFLQLSSPKISAVEKEGSTEFVLAYASCPKDYHVNQKTAQAAGVGLIVEGDKFSFYKDIRPKKTQLFTRMVEEFNDGRFAPTTLTQSPFNDPRIDKVLAHCKKNYKRAQANYDTAGNNGNYQGGVQAREAMDFNKEIIEMLGGTVD